MRTRKQFIDPNPALVSVEGACRYLGGICRASLYELINEGKIRSIKIAGRRMVQVESMDTLIAKASSMPETKLSTKIQGAADKSEEASV